MTQIATLIFVAGVIGLFLLDRDPKARFSVALWLPVMWLLLGGSRPLSAWLGITGNRGFDSDALQQQFLDGSPLDRDVYLALLLTGVCVLVARQPSLAKILRANWPLLAFLIYCAASVFWSDYLDVAFRRWIKSLGDYVMFLLILTDRDRRAALKHVLARVAFVLLPLSVLFIKYYPSIGRSYATRWEATQFYVGAGENKNTLGMTCLVFGLAACWRVMQELRNRSPWRKRTLLVHGTLLVMTAWLLRMANSMTSLSCFVLAAGIMGATTFLNFGRRRWLVHLAFFGALMVCVFPLFLNIGGGVLEKMGRNSSLTGRTEIWGELLKVPINPIVGTGFESFWLGRRLELFWSLPNMTGINEAHNGFLEAYLNLGVIGVALLVLLLCGGYSNVLSELRRDPESATIRLAYLFVAIAYSCTEAAFRMMNPIWILCLFAATRVKADPKRRAMPVMPSEKLSASERVIANGPSL